MAKEQRRKRRKFSDEYKAETVRLIQSSGKSVGQMARGTGHWGDGAATLVQLRPRWKLGVVPRGR